MREFLLSDMVPHKAKIWTALKVMDQNTRMLFITDCALSAVKIVRTFPGDDAYAESLYSVHLGPSARRAYEAANFTTAFSAAEGATVGGINGAWSRAKDEELRQINSIIYLLDL
jgi:hypothetical protein